MKATFSFGLYKLALLHFFAALFVGSMEGLPIPAMAYDEHIISSDLAEGNDQFGQAVSMDANRIVIGARSDDEGRGSVHVFLKTENEWAQEAKLFASDVDPVEYLGWAVSISGDYLIAGAPNKTDSAWQTGASYIFARSGETWTEQAKLISSAPEYGSNFGYSVSIKGDTALIGEPYASGGGKAHIFTRSGSVWNHSAVISEANSSKFGYSVQLQAGAAIIGAPEGYDGRGEAFIYTGTGSNWIQSGLLRASDASSGDNFGGAVALFGDTCLIGAYGDDIGGADVGSAYVFVRNGSTWSQQAKLISATGNSYDNFGRNVSLYEDNALVTTNESAALSDQNSICLFIRNDDNWNEALRFSGSDDNLYHYSWGNGIFLGGNVAIAGSRAGSPGGSIYVFSKFWDDCEYTDVEIWMPSNYFAPGDKCSCLAYVCNTENRILSGYPLLVLLDVFGSYYFAPGFSHQIDSYQLGKVPIGKSSISIMEEFSWPTGGGTASGLIWYGALTNPEFSEIFGSIGQFEFGWGN